MERVYEVAGNVWGVGIFLSVGYSFFFGVLFPEIWLKLKFDRLSKYPIVNALKSSFSFVIYMVISIIPGIILSRIFHIDYGMLSWLFFFIGIGARRILHETGIWRGPPWF